MGKGGGHRDGGPEKGAFLRRAALYLYVGLELPGTVIGGVVLGYLLDLYLGTAPWFVIGLAFVAFLGACFRLMRWVRFFSSRES